MKNILNFPKSNQAQMRKRLSALQSHYENKQYVIRAKSEQVVTLSNSSAPSTRIENYYNGIIAYAGLNYTGRQIFIVSLLFSAFGFFLGQLINFFLGILLCLLCFYLPISYLRSLAERRSKLFSSEYPSILLAMASNMKAGLTVYSSLERSIALLPKESYVKKEVSSFLEKISRGVSTEKAVSEFADDINLKELELFRRAFALVIVHGGKFSRTLERLAQVTRDRENLINSSRVSTASMRMTSNVLLVVAPFLLFILSAKNKNFWPTLLGNNVAFTLGVVGALTITLSVYVLRRMSDFKP